MNIDWTKGLKGKEKEDFETVLRNSRIQFTRLRDMLQDKKNEIERAEINKLNYDNPAWAYKQAYFNGEKSMLQYVIDLISFVK